MERVPGPYRTLLYKLGIQLTKDDLKGMKFLLTTDPLQPELLRQEDLNNVKHALDLFLLMERWELLSARDLTVLRSLLNVIGRQDLIKKYLRAYQEDTWDPGSSEGYGIDSYNG